MKVRKHIILYVLFGLISVKATAQHAAEFQVKAAFLYNFSKFLEWPAESVNNTGEPFVIGVYGIDPFGNYLDEILAGEKVMGRPMVVERFTDAAKLKNCQILFINAPGKTAEALNAVKGMKVLTVSDDPDFCALGGIIRFYTENEMIRIEINMNAVKAANLNISSKLLRMAKLCEQQQ